MAGSIPDLSVQVDAPDFDTISVTTTHLNNNVYMLQGFGGNIGVSIGDDGVFIIDDQYAQLTDKIRAAIMRLTRRPISFVVNSHFHGDHSGGNANLAQANATIIAHDNTRKHLLKGIRVKGIRANRLSSSNHLPVITFNKTMTLHLNGHTVQAIHVPNAHTDGDLLIHFLEADVIHTGDGYFNGFYPYIDIENGGSVDGMIAFAEKLITMSGSKTRIIPGHGGLSNREQVIAYLQMLTSVRARVLSALTRGVTLDDLIAREPLKDLDEKWGNNLIKAPQLLAIVYASLIERNDQPAGVINDN